MLQKTWTASVVSYISSYFELFRKKDENLTEKYHTESWENSSLFQWISALVSANSELIRDFNPGKQQDIHHQKELFKFCKNQIFELESLWLNTNNFSQKQRTFSPWMPSRQRWTLFTRTINIWNTQPTFPFGRSYFESSIRNLVSWV